MCSSDLSIEVAKLAGLPNEVIKRAREVLAHVEESSKAVRDAVDAYVGLWGAIDGWSGRAFNLGGGPDNAVSLNQLLTYMSELLGRPVRIGQEGWRAGDQRYFVSDRRAIAAALDLAEPIPWRAGVRDLAAWLEDQGVGEARSAPHYAQAAT